VRDSYVHLLYYLVCSSYFVVLFYLYVINQSIKIYTAPLQDLYSEALPTQGQAEKNSLVA